ncbi:hypothetical protein BBO99_00007230 [Phytophthora kernoviae]|uniref:COP9 signalosome complex subunit 3 n=2 Tax=Phytophthora kernoviae TaxID=325452 RepID=A0A3R7J7C3_9STRA|nr:hypothetical protein G195_008064 [Phytophthora kernoviae 00238/432]KAG2520287.1 hypothetical protein JM16_006786 [Phytophthora kernoviae]KAG2521223.1 hypothetical protein JM18_006694 [Phytophthora kernoviae]RLN32450.1 hypothetical protein BBI17_007200 [Phytophthora kernoviae]RLN76828.1 hypothetical protein BBO99_00007230 [Phytophthora kernoviae]
MEWGPLQPLLGLLTPEDTDNEDRKQADATLAMALGSEELTAAIKTASIAQLDLVLTHDALAIDRKPLSFLLLLSAKTNKMEHSRGRHEEQLEERGRLLLQISQLFYQVPVAVAAREIKRVSVLCGQYARLAVELNQSVKTIFPLKSFLKRFHQQGHAVLTPMHAQFFYLCLQAKCYFAAMEILDRPVLEIHSQSHLVNCVDFLGYAYYGGLLYLGEKRHQDALDFFQLAITAPAVSLSAFVIESYKKLLLVTLILCGEAAMLPKYTPFVVTRHIENHCTAYTDLVSAFVVEKNLVTVVEVVTKHEELFTQDGNFGLVKQCVQAFKQRKLLQLTRTYATIELAEVATTAGMTSNDAVIAEKMLLALISTNQMHAVIDKQKAMVRFVLENEDGGLCNCAPWILS